MAKSVEAADARVRSSRSDSVPAFDAALDALARGGIVAAPTETLIGLLADIRFPAALERLVRLKSRAAAQPFPVMIPEMSAIRSVSDRIPLLAARAMDVFWPGRSP